MAGSSLLALIDDIATILDDVAILTKTAAKKTAGVLGDDLALNAQQVSGIQANRELPVVWAVAKGSALNKVILVPLALFLSWIAPWAVIPLLMFGGLFLCYEGVEKLAHKFLHSAEEDEEHHKELVEAVADPSVDLVEFEKEKISGAVRTDFILSAEIVAITLGLVAAEPFKTRFLVLVGISLIMTVGVYGLVAGIVKLDDLGTYLAARDNPTKRKIGNWILVTAPYFMKTISILGTIAMFLVGGSILVHGIEAAHHLSHDIAHAAAGLPVVGGFLEAILPKLFDLVVGLVSGALALLAVTGIKKLLPSRKEQEA
jgi:uncharacterized protein